MLTAPGRDAIAAQRRHNDAPIRSVRMHNVEISPGVVMAYEDDCFAPPWTTPETVVLVHGNSESSRAWIPWVPLLAGRYRVIRLDLPGFGASTAPADYGFSAPEAAAEIARLLDRLGIVRCHLMGAKYGGSIALPLPNDPPPTLPSA